MYKYNYTNINIYFISLLGPNTVYTYRRLYFNGGFSKEFTTRSVVQTQLVHEVVTVRDERDDSPPGARCSICPNPANQNGLQNGLKRMIFPYN